MVFYSFDFLKHPSMAASRSLFLLILILLSTCSWFFFSSTPLTLLSFLLTISFPFIFLKLEQRVRPSQKSSQEKRKDVKVAAFEEGISDELIISDQKLMLGSDCSVFEDSNLFRSSQSSEKSISDDESLIEIALPDGHYLGSRKTSSEFELELLDYLPKSLFLQHGLMEILLEINDEYNMIEIDIAMGSIKCPRFEIKALACCDFDALVLNVSSKLRSCKIS